MVDSESHASNLCLQSSEKWSEEGIVTYKRRKVRKDNSGSVSQIVDQVDVKQGDINLQNNWRNTVLVEMYNSLNESDDGLLGSIRDAILYYPENVKDAVQCHGDRLGYFSHKGVLPKSLLNTTKGNSHVSNGTIDELDHNPITKLCQHAFFTVLISEKFSPLCKLLLEISENFKRIKLDSFLDISLINSKMQRGTYEQSPELFFSDFKQVRGFSKCSSEDKKPEVFTQESEDKTEQTRAGVTGVYSCRQCGDKANEKNCLVCDSCEEMYHVNCIEPAVVEVPSRNWYCANCTSLGIGSPHEACVVCERCEDSKNLINETGKNLYLTFEEPDELEEISDVIIPEWPLSSLDENVAASFKRCNFCKCKIETGEIFKECRHPYCYVRYYHVRCLTEKQLKSCGAIWYCPSCLCRACLVDRDDDEIVMCDACDHAYHIYCMEPRCDKIPDGKWFCKKCADMIQSIGKAKRAYMRNELKIKAYDGKKL